MALICASPGFFQHIFSGIWCLVCVGVIYVLEKPVQWIYKPYESFLKQYHWRTGIYTTCALPCFLLSTVAILPGLSMVLVAVFSLWAYTRGETHA